MAESMAKIQTSIYSIHMNKNQLEFMKKKNPTLATTKCPAIFLKQSALYINVHNSTTGLGPSKLSVIQKNKSSLENYSSLRHVKEMWKLNIVLFSLTGVHI